MKIAFVAEGDAETRNCWSGCARSFVHALRGQGAWVTTFNAEPGGWRRLALAAAAWRFSTREWRNAFRFGGTAFRMRSQLAAAVLRGASQTFDAVVQAGATFDIPGPTSNRARRIVYADANIAFAASGAPYSGASSLSPATLASIARRERRVYEAADRVWTWSDALRRSFEEDFGLPPDRLRTIYAGANTTPPADAKRSGAPRILFVGKDMRRKGIDVLLEAFGGVRAAVPDAELHIVGGQLSGRERLGVFGHGFVPAGTPEGHKILSDLYSSATVFCLPSRYEPFGAVFIEAMLAGLPCIGTDGWAMPEIIRHGETGWLVPDGDAAALRTALVEALTNRDRSERMGEAGRRRALDLFTWDRVAARALDDLDGLLGGDGFSSSSGGAL